ncbi:MAG TPA: glycine oxidase ThiO [Actinomycetota bacterium]|nr:glycine oxidase ThiO [Actinomycetota bacterium]
MSDPDVIVIGGGIIGSSIAWRTARRGAAVTVVDDPERAAAAEVAAGMLAPVTEATFGEDDLLQLNLRSLEMYPRFVDELEAQTGRDVGFVASGTLMVARDTDDMAAFTELFDYQRAHGLAVERLSSRRARELEPSLSPRVRGAFNVPGDHHVDPAALLEALRAACNDERVIAVAERATAVLRERGKVVGARLASGDEIRASRVVVAAGAWSSDLDGVAHPVEVRPVKGQLVHLKTRPGHVVPSRTIRGVDAYIVTRRDGRVVIGATVEEKGFDTTASAGAVHDLLHYAFELVPGLMELVLDKVTVGLRPGSRSNAPLIGALEPNLFVATGHFRNGILLAPVTGEAIATLVTGSEVPEWLAPFAPDVTVAAR